MDFVQSLDPSKLVLAGTVRTSMPGSQQCVIKLLLQGLSFFLALGVSPPYNLPVFLFGCYAQENTEAVQSLQTVSFPCKSWSLGMLYSFLPFQFTSLLGVSFIFDIIWTIRNDQHGFFKFLTILLILLKIPTFFAFMMALRQRGLTAGNFGIGLGSAGPAGLCSGRGYKDII